MPNFGRRRILFFWFRDAGVEDVRPGSFKEWSRQILSLPWICRACRGSKTSNRSTDGSACGPSSEKRTSIDCKAIEASKIVLLPPCCIPSIWEWADDRAGPNRIYWPREDPLPRTTVPIGLAERESRLTAQSAGRRFRESKRTCAPAR